MQTSFDLLTDVIRIETLAIISVLGLLIVFKMATGEIRLSGLLSDKKTGAISPARVQSLILTLAMAGVLSTGFDALADIGSELPAILFGGSQTLYLFSKSETFRK